MFTTITIVTLSLITIAALVAIHTMSKKIASLKRTNEYLQHLEAKDKEIMRSYIEQDDRIDALIYTIDVKDEQIEKLNQRYDWLVARYNRLLGDYTRSNDTILRLAKQRSELQTRLAQMSGTK